MGLKRIGAVGVFAFTALAVAGCGSGASSTVTESQTTTVFLPAGGATAAAPAAGAPATAPSGADASAGKSLEIQMGDYFFKPSAVTATAGSVKINAPNNGGITHELVLLRTDLDPAKLPTDANGEVNEDKFESPGEIPDVPAGSAASTKVDLKPGKYVIICNLPGHYAQGMYGSLTVPAG